MKNYSYKLMFLLACHVDVEHCFAPDKHKIGDNAVHASNHFFMDGSISRRTTRTAKRAPGKGSSEMSTRSDVLMDAWSCAPPNNGQGHIF